MNFIERLRQELVVEKQKEAQKTAQQEAIEKARFQKETDERERRVKRKEQSEKFREESGVSQVVDKLANFFSSQIREVIYIATDSDHHTYEYTRQERRGGRVRENEFAYIPCPGDSDSIYDVVHWDGKKYIDVESCPDGTIVFHGDRKGSTTIRTTEWRNKEKEQLFDKALEKAYNSPKIRLSHPFHELLP